MLNWFTSNVFYAIKMSVCTIYYLTYTPWIRGRFEFRDAFDISEHNLAHEFWKWDVVDFNPNWVKYFSYHKYELWNNNNW